MSSLTFCLATGKPFAVSARTNTLTSAIGLRGAGIWLRNLEVNVMFDSIEYEGINSFQALLLANIDNEEIVIRDLIERGNYQSTNVSYNLKKLDELGYIERERSDHDRRSMRIRLIPQA